MTLKEIRKLNKMTQKQLAEKIGTTQQAVARWEKGKPKPNMQSIIKLAKILNVSTEDIIRAIQIIKN